MIEHGARTEYGSTCTRVTMHREWNQCTRHRIKPKRSIIGNASTHKDIVTACKKPMSSVFVQRCSDPAKEAVSSPHMAHDIGDWIHCDRGLASKHETCQNTAAG
eukprot:SAG31_NODE_879_length_11292_cov_49.116680_4_plen_104_part_00